ncbi:hypothetical protein [Kocuria sabuli]|uniref:hypothetical protein n=1 Tax=Kocuria sabuli TaxID=3071448 RepID=UPI0034D7725C
MWQNGMPCYVAFCENCTPVTSGAVSQCEGIDAGAVDHFTGGNIGDQGPSSPEFPPADGRDPCRNEDANGVMHCCTPVS